MDEHQEIIQHQQSQEPSKLAPQIPNPLKSDSSISFENDFGETPVGLGHFTLDQGWIAILTLAGAFVGAAFGGLPFAGVILLAGANDLRFAGLLEEKNTEKHIQQVPLPTLSESVEVPEKTQSFELTQTELASQQHNTENTAPLAVTTNSSTKWLNNFISQTALIWGNQGSGKSWIVRYLTQLKKDKGYRIVVLDPDSNRAEWKGVESYHDFEEIQEFLRWYVEELKARYKAFNDSEMTEDEWRAKLWDSGKAIAVICEEVTTYVDLIEDQELLTQFSRLGLTKSRKQEMPLLFVSHNNTQSALGGISGLKNLIDKMLQLSLKTNINPETLQPTASGQGQIKLDGSNEWLPVILPKQTEKITHFGEPHPVRVTSLVKKTEGEEKMTPNAVQEATDFKVSDSLSEPLKTIWLACKEKGDWVTTRELYQKSLAVLKNRSVKNIRQYFGLLADKGFGDIDEMDGDKPKSDSSVGFKAY